MPPCPECRACSLVVKEADEPFVVKIGVDRRLGELYIGSTNNAAQAAKEKRMFTAEMVLDLVKDSRATCKGLDEWIERDVVSHFKKHPALPMQVAQVALQVKAWSDQKFVEEMQDRGFCSV